MIEQPSTEHDLTRQVDTSVFNTANEVTAALNQAERLVANNQIDEATRIYTAILSQHPYHAHANYGLGVIEANTLGALKALPRFELSIKSAPDNEQYWVSYIDALLLSQQYDKAKAAIQLGLKYGLGQAYAEQLLSECYVQPAPSLVATPSHEKPSKQTQPDDFKVALASLIQANILEIRQYQQRVEDGDKTATLSPDLNIDAIKCYLEAWISGQHYDELLLVINVVIAELIAEAELVGHKIYTPDFDHILAKLDFQIEQIVPKENKSCNLVIATEVYNYGGHTREIAAMLKQLDNPVLVITDLYNRVVENQLFEQVAESMPLCPVLILPKDSNLDKSKRLAALINQMAKNVYLLSHHNDSVAIAACQKQFDVTYYFIHHGDHNVALGNHTPHFHHVDLFANRAGNCAHDLNRNTTLLPASADDHGLKTFTDTMQSMSTVTAGSFGKFKTSGWMNLSNLVIQAITVTEGNHYHFGTIPDENLSAIKQALKVAGIDPQRFIYKGNVKSLWDSLKEIDAHVFIGSAPVMGAKSDIEAQGAGYPLLAFRSLTCPRHLNVGSHSPETVYWHDIESFKQGLALLRVQHAAYSNASRAFYLAHCTTEHYQSALKAISQ